MDPITIVNASGFPFQLRVEQEICGSFSGLHGWKVAAREHRAIDLETTEERFIDLVLEKDRLRMPIECKRVRGGRWVFLVSPEQQTVRRAELLRAERRQAFPQDVFEYRSFALYPETPESNFCAVQGGSDRERPMLERVGGELIRQSESLAGQEVQVSVHRPEGTVFIHVPVIVTNAELVVVVCDPAKISLTNGEVPEGTLANPVSVVRFTKNLSSTIGHHAPTIQELNRKGNRTIFVVQASRIVDFLRLFQFDPDLMSS